MTTTATADARPGLATAHRMYAFGMPVLVLVQAALAGQHLFEGSSISVHGILGNVSFALTVVGVGLALVRRCEAAVFFVAVALLALAFAQVGLGYVGRETLSAAAWHIPNGVAIFGLTTYQLALVTRATGAPPGR